MERIVLSRSLFMCLLKSFRGLNKGFEDCLLSFIFIPVFASVLDLSFSSSQSFFYLFIFPLSFSIVFHISRLELGNNLLFLNSNISGFFIAFFSQADLCSFAFCWWLWMEAVGTCSHLLGRPFSWAVQLLVCIFHFLHQHRQDNYFFCD